ncbi:Uncharacterized protein OBRU01_07665 [Operophtera brumata]|uniref:Uncharacterized protein n=1 Tax=Operophtera brumata TaxID=104452 RepID=A0A0L7LIS3_OPEBR|nr:Uncharacterized protein OBRU01_07665 [Operophtera brumata]
MGQRDPFLPHERSALRGVLLAAARGPEEAVQAPSHSQYKPAVYSLLHNLEGPQPEPPRPASNLHAAQEVGRRVTQIFHHSKTNMHLQNIFKKKT